MIIAKYKFNSTLYDLIPVFNDGYSGYTVTDDETTETDSNGNIIKTRTIECDTLPTLMIFGNIDGSGATATPDKYNSLLTVDYLNGTNIIDAQLMFHQCANVTRISSFELSDKNTNLFGTISGCQKLTSIDVSNWNTSNITNMSSIFNNCNSLISLDVSNFDTSNVTNMQDMFNNCNSLTTLDVSNFDTSNVTTMNSMFSRCQSLTSLDVSNFDTNNVTTMNSMFFNCYSLSSLDIGNWDTSNVTDMDGIFYNCNKLTQLDVSNFDTSNVTNMRSIFDGCKNLTSIDVSNFDTSNVTNMEYMFQGCSKLTTLDIGNWDISRLSSMNNIFSNCTDLQYINCNNISTINKLASSLPTRTSDSQGVITCKQEDLSSIDATTLSSKYWYVSHPTSHPLLAKYKFNNTIYADLLPVFNDGYTGYTITDEIDTNDSSITIRTITYMDELPTLIRFGYRDEKEHISYDASKSLLYVEHLDVSKITNMRDIFRNCENLIRVETDNWNTSKVTDMSCMFEYCSKLTSIDVSNFDTSNVTNMGYMFNGCQSLTQLDVSNWDTSKVTNMRSIFYGCTSLASIDLSNFDTSSVTTMYNMFYGCTSLTSIDLSNFDTSSVTTMDYMFTNCYNLTSIDLSNFNTGNVTTMNSMFYNCNKLTQLDVSNFDTSKVVDMAYMFYGCNNLTTLNVSKWNTSNVTNMYYMFYNCNNLTTLDVSKWNTNNVIKMHYMFYNCNKLTTIDVSKWNTNNVTDMRSVFNNCNKLTTIDVSNWNTSKVTSMYNMFNNCQLLTQLDVSNFDTSNVTDMNSMFYGCKLLTSLDVSNFDTSKVTNMYGMFYGCNKLTILDLSNFDTSNVTNMEYMFRECQSLTSLDVSNFNTSNVTNMNSMFYNCQLLTSLDVSNFNTSNVTTMNSMFYNCQLLTSLDVSNFNTSNVTYMDYMLTDTPLLTDIGMLYCSEDTINTITPLLPTNINRTIYYQDANVNNLTVYNNITYKQYTEEIDIYLSTPLLEGDEIIKKDGKYYHYHKMGMVVLDGSGYWEIDTQLPSVNRFFGGYSSGSNDMSQAIFDAKASINVHCDKFPSVVDWNIDSPNIYLNDNKQIVIMIDKSISSVDAFKQWLSENPTTVIYELAKPYYEELGEKELILSLSDTNTNELTNNSIIPTNMNVTNNSMSTVAIGGSSTYTIAFDKDVDTNVTVNLNGTSIDTTDNVVEITTSSELGDNEITFLGEGKISNVRILGDSMSGDAIPRESFEGLKNSFEDGKLPNAIYTNEGGIITINGDTWLKLDSSCLSNNNTYTLYMEVTENTSNTKLAWELGDSGDSKLYVAEGDVGIFIKKVTTIDTLSNIVWVTGTDYNGNTIGTPTGSITVKNLKILEGDWTHLSEEDFNNLGKYKVEYKVVGKNKFDINSSKINTWNCNYTINSNKLELAPTSAGRVAYARLSTHFKKNKKYTLTWNMEDTSMLGDWGSGVWYKDTTNYITPIQSSIQSRVYDIKEDVDVDLVIYINTSDLNNKLIISPQIEENTTSTEYEPYKSYTKTFYLSSPLLEGDTIEDVNGKATHVHRYGMVVLDGSEDEIWEYSLSYETSTNQTDIRRFSYCPTPPVRPVALTEIISVCDRFNTIANTNWHEVSEHSETDKVNRINIAIFANKLSTQDVPGFKQWLSENPTTVVYELATPTYETISEESILCESYTNGHLDVNTNIPIEKAKFNVVSFNLKYLYPSTSYVLQFESDNIGVLKYGFNNYSNEISIVKGINRIDFVTSSTVSNTYLVFNGIGFNASNIQVVATDRNNIGYFKGIESSFESKKNANELDENYGKYEVEVKMVGKNKFNNNISLYSEQSGVTWSFIENGYRVTGDANNIARRCYHSEIKVESGKTYYVSANINVISGNLGTAGIRIAKMNADGTIGSTIFYLHPNSLKVKFTCDGSYSSVFIQLYGTSHEAWADKTIVEYTNIQFEEGNTATEYEKYKENIETIYLNSPLLKGDKIEMYNGKLCHYHKMGMVTFNGSEDWKIERVNGTITRYYVDSDKGLIDAFPNDSTRFTISNLFGKTYTSWGNEREGFYRDNSLNRTWINILTHKASTVDTLIKLLQSNPATVVYELAEPYYEIIEPQQDEFTIVSIGESSISIDSGNIPTNSEVTYNVNVKLLNDLEEQINSTSDSSKEDDLSSLLDDIINE